MRWIWEKLKGRYKSLIEGRPLVIIPQSHLLLRNLQPSSLKRALRVILKEDNQRKLTTEAQGRGARLFFNNLKQYTDHAQE